MIEYIRYSGNSIGAAIKKFQEQTMYQLNVNLPDQAIVKLREAAKADGRSLSSYVRQVLKLSLPEKDRDSFKG